MTIIHRPSISDLFPTPRRYLSMEWEWRWISTLYYNPYVKTVDGELSIEPANAADYVDRSRDFSHKIDHDDLCYKLFTEHGFEWGGDWTHSKDYQHFEK